MTWNDLAAIATVVATVLAAWGLYRTVRSDARKRADADRAEKEKIRTDAFAEGVRSMASTVAMKDWEITQKAALEESLRRELGELRDEARDWEKRYLDLRDKGTR